MSLGEDVSLLVISTVIARGVITGPILGKKEDQEGSSSGSSMTSNSSFTVLARKLITRTNPVTPRQSTLSRPRGVLRSLSGRSG